MTSSLAKASLAHRRRILICVVLAGMMWSAAAHASALLHFPLPGSPCPTSSFGSRRATHIHAGIDFSTGGRTGMPVLAVDTCWVWRVSVKNSGYGRALYAVLPGGEVAVYGHLSRFTAPIEKAVEKEQNSQGLYEVEIYNEPERFAFSPGDTIAFSGDTGSGPPHLHFELRSGQVDHDDLSPLPDRLDLREDIPPAIKRIRIYPLGPDCTLNGAHKPIAMTRAEPSRPLAIAGAFGVEVYATDVARCERVISPATYEASIDGEMVWRLDLSVFPFARSNFSTFLYDEVDGTPYVRLFDPYGLDLEGFACYRPSGSGFFRSIAPGSHTLRVAIGDPWGNTDEMVIPFKYGRVPDFETCALVDGPGGLAFRAGAAGDDCALGVSYRSRGGAWRDAEVAREGRSWSGHLPDPSEARASGAGVASAGSAGGTGGARSGAASGGSASCEVLFRLTDPSGLSRECLLASGGSSDGSSASGGKTTGIEATRIETTVHPDFVEIVARTPAAPRSLPLAEVLQGGNAATIALQPIDRNVFRACYFPEEADDPIEIKAMFEFDRASIERTARIQAKWIQPGRTVETSAGALSVEISSRRGNMKTMAVASAGDRSSFAGFDASAGSIVFEPNDVFFGNGADVRVRAGAAAAGHGLFSLAYGSPSLLATFDESGECRARIYTLDPLVVLRDARPPSVRFVGTLTRKRDGIAVFGGSVSDAGSGVASESIRASVDGEPAIASYDPDTGAIKVRTTKPLPYGKHVLTLEARDRIGNAGRSQIERELLR